MRYTWRAVAEGPGWVVRSNAPLGLKIDLARAPEDGPVLELLFRNRDEAERLATALNADEDARRL